MLFLPSSSSLHLLGLRSASPGYQRNSFSSSLEPLGHDAILDDRSIRRAGTRLNLWNNGGYTSVIVTVAENLGSAGTNHRVVPGSSVLLRRRK
jgi:hypothetical protein